MGVMSDAHWWWEESQMRVLVLSSLVVQFLLSFLTLLRRHHMPGWFRYMMWMTFLVSDTLVIYALATLFDRHKADGGGRRGGSSTLEVVWAPILLAHLGGLHGVTAWNIEDNEKWSGYLLTAVYQVALAIYVFCKSWPPGGDKNLLKAAILLFVYGGLKCFEKPWAVKRSSFTSLAQSALDGERTARQSEGEMGVLEYVKAARGFVQEQDDDDESLMGVLEDDEYVRAVLVREQDNDEGEAQEAGAPVEEDCYRHHPRPSQQDSVINQTQHHARRQELWRKICDGEAYKLILDHRSPPYRRRLTILKIFWGLSEHTAYGCVREQLAGAFLQFYTRLKLMTLGISDLEKKLSAYDVVITIISGQLARLVPKVLPWAAIGLFHQSHREAYNGIDVKITYALLCCTAVLEASYTFAVPIKLAEGPGAYDFRRSTEQWPEKVPQLSLMAYFALNKNHSSWMWIVHFLGCKGLLDHQWTMMRPGSSAGTITGLVLAYLKAGWKEKIQDAASYRRFNDSRGHWALEGHGHLSWSINGQLDESVLLWHLATDFFFFLSNQATSQRREKISLEAVHCKEISNYMMYLLFFNPEMLSPGTRRNLFKTAYDDLKGILRDVKKNPLSWSQCREEMLTKRLIATMLEKSKVAFEEESKGSFIQDAWYLAEGLLKLRDDFGDEKMWEMIQGVWVEMLCFSASRCRGYLHAKALGSGGEFLSYVWLLLFHMGMETFSERLQGGREEPPRWESNNSAPRPSADAHNGNATTPSTSEVHISVSPSPENHIIGEELA